MPLKKFTSRLSLLKIEEQVPFSGGMKQKLALQSPDTQTHSSISDEPTLGVDPFPEKSFGIC
jgi:ABC-type multidrug transport system ATPase subunit